MPPLPRCLPILALPMLLMSCLWRHVLRLCQLPLEHARYARPLPLCYHYYAMLVDADAMMSPPYAPPPPRHAAMLHAVCSCCLRRRLLRHIAALMPLTRGAQAVADFYAAAALSAPHAMPPIIYMPRRLMPWRYLPLMLLTRYHSLLRDACMPSPAMLLLDAMLMILLICRRCRRRHFFAAASDIAPCFSRVSRD